MSNEEATKELSPSSLPPAVAVSGLCFAWLSRSKGSVFSDVAFTIAPGESVAIIGPNGAGKSTLLRCLAGILRPTAGSVALQGCSIDGLSPKALARQVAFLPQTPASIPAMRVRDIIVTGRYPYFTFFAPIAFGDRRAVAEAMAMTGTAHLADRRFDKLSGGERQRVLLAAAIAQDAPILLLDEPFTFLDPAGQAAFSAIIAQLRLQRGVTVVTVTHDLARAAADGCRIIGLAGGVQRIDAPANQALDPDTLAAVFGCAFDVTPPVVPRRIEVLPTKMVTPPTEGISPPDGRPWRVFLLGALGVLGCFAVVTVLAALIGRPMMSPTAMLTDRSGMEAKLFMALRMPRSVTAFLVGAALSLAGLVFQAMFRNPLATPYTLGVSGGASFGAVVALQLGVAASLPFHLGVQSAAFLGAMLSIAIVYGTFRLQRRASVTTMLLAGVGCSLLFSSLIMLLQYICDPAKTIHTLYWMMGGILVAGFDDALRILPALAFGVGTTAALAGELDVMLLGDEIALSRGVNIVRVRKVLFVAVSLMTAAVVALCGPIGFVGMIVPHVCRMHLGPLHRRLVPASLAAGGVFLLVCDVVARTIVSPAELPVGVVTSLFGAPFLLLLLQGRFHPTSSPTENT